MAALINNLNDIILALITLVPNIIGLCSIVAALFPKPRKAGWMKTAHKWVNRAAFNVKNAANRD